MPTYVWVIVAAVLIAIFLGVKRTARNNTNPIFQKLERELMSVVIESGDSLDESAQAKIESILRNYDLSATELVHVTTMMDIQLSRLAYTKQQMKSISALILAIGAGR